VALFLDLGVNPESTGSGCGKARERTITKKFRWTFDMAFVCDLKLRLGWQFLLFENEP
jgi:hypothetical protein